MAILLCTPITLNNQLSVLTYLIFKGIFDAIKFVKINNKMLDILIKT
jgi:hypothetical protein